MGKAVLDVSLSLDGFITGPNVSREQFTEGEGKGHLAILVPFPLRDADLAALHINFIEANGQCKTSIDALFALQDAAQAHRLIEGGHVRGKLVLAIA